MSDIAEAGAGDVADAGDVCDDVEGVVADRERRSVVSEEPGDLKRLCFSERVSKRLDGPHVTKRESPGSDSE